IGEAAAALLLAARHPERVRSLVIVNGFACVRRSADYPIGASDEVITAVLESHHLMADGFDFVAALAPSMVGNNEFRAWWERAARRGASPASSRALQVAVVNADVRGELSKIEAPTLVIQRKDNRLFPAPYGRYLAEHIPHATYRELPGADTWWWV